MADEKIVFEVDVTSLAKGLADSQTQLEIYKRDMEAAIEANGRFSEQANLAAGLVAAQTKAVQQQTGAITRLTQAELALGGSINEITKSYDADTKSVDQNRKVLNALTAEYNKLGKEGRDRLAPTIKKISDTLKEQEGQIGDTRRNVGNYFNEFAKGVPQLGAAVEGVKNLGVAFKGAGGGVAGLAAGFASLGLPILISGVTLLIDAFSSFEPIANAVSDTMAGISASFSSSYAEGVKLSQLKREIEINNRNELVTNAELKKSITELESVAANKAAKDQDRIDALEKANKLRDRQLQIDKENLEEDKKALDLEIKLSKESNKNKAAALGTLNVLLGLKATEIEANKELLKQQKQLEADRIGLEERAFQQQQDNRNKIDLLNKQIAEDKKAALDKSLADQKKLSDEEEKIRQKNLDNDRLVFIEQEKLRQDFLEQKDKEIAEAKKANDEVLAAQLQSERDFRNKQDSDASDYLKKVQDNANKEIAIQKQKQSDINTIVSAGFEFVTNIISTIGNAIQESTRAQIDNEEKANTERENSYKRSLEAGLISKEEFNKLTAESDAKLAEETREQNRKAYEANKAIQITMAIINTAQAVIAQLSNPTPYVGFVLSALAAATGAIQVGIIAAQPAPKFATGVIGLDGDGTETSDSIDARLSKGESVLTAKATRKYHRQLAYMEMSVGNKPNYQFGGGMFAGGFIPSVSGDGGFLARETIKQSDSALMMSEAIRNGFALAPAPVLSIVELNTKQRDINRSVNLSEA